MVRRTRDAEAELNLPPGFRFHPTDEELVVSYLCRKVAHQRLPVPIIAEVDLYKFDPWQLPEKALFGSKEWYFFTPRDRKYPNGLRPNRAAGGGYWKATGADKPVVPAGSARALGIKKALVFYAGRAPRGAKTNWIMHEYRLADGNRAAGKAAGGSQRLDDWVLCRLYNKKNEWGEETRQPGEESSTGNAAADSFEAGGDTGSESFRTPESDVDNGDFTEGHDGVRRPSPFGASAGAARAARGGVVGVVKEETDWFTDLNLDDLQSSLTAGGGAPPLDLSYQDCYLLSLASPQLKPGQNYLPPF